MYFDKELSSGRAFMELERRGDRLAVKRCGFASRHIAKGVQPHLWAATESPLIHDGSQNTLSTSQNANNSTVTGTTLAGPSGSGQFLCAVLTGSRTLSIASSTAGASFATQPFYGVIQNKPGPSQAVDAGIFGISKVVAGSTSILAGSVLMMSTAGGSSLNGSVNLWAAGSGPRIGIALEAPTAAGQVITAAINLSGANFGST